MARAPGAAAETVAEAVSGVGRAATSIKDGAYGAADAVARLAAAPSEIAERRRRDQEVTTWGRGEAILCRFVPVGGWEASFLCNHSERAVVLLIRGDRFVFSRWWVLERWCWNNLWRCVELLVRVGEFSTWRPAAIRLREKTGFARRWLLEHVLFV